MERSFAAAESSAGPSTSNGTDMDHVDNENVGVERIHVESRGGAKHAAIPSSSNSQ